MRATFLFLFLWWSFPDDSSSSTMRGMARSRRSRERERERKEGRNYEEVVERKYLLLRLKKMRVFVMDVVILHSLFRKASSFIFFYLLIH